MAHVMIPAREDVEAGAIHHSAPSMASISLSGEGCEVEKVDGSSFVIRVPQPSFDAFGAITDLSPVWDSVINTQEDVNRLAEESKQLRIALADLKDTVSSLCVRMGGMDSTAGRIVIDIDGLTANHDEARQKQSYITLAAFIAMVLSFIAMGLALWTLRA